MDEQNQNYSQQGLDSKKDTIYKFFYNIWPSVNRAINVVVYYTIKIARGFFRVALEQIKSK